MKTYPLFKIHIDVSAALEKLGEVLRSGFINEGVQVTELTNAFQQRFNTERLVLANSCTSTIVMALKLSGVRAWDEVITTPMTCVATNCPIATMNANLAWADINPETGCIDPTSVKLQLDSNPKTKAVIAVAWAGNPPELAELSDICNFYGAKLILDAAHAFGAKFNGCDISTIPDFTCYSFQAIKHITTGDGGMLICKHENDWKLAKQLKWFGIDRDAAKDASGNWKGQHWDFDIITPGYKFNMNNMAAAVGLSQLPHIDTILESHRTNASTYDSAFLKSEFLFPLKGPVNAQSAHWVYTLLLKENYKQFRDELLQRLNKENIMAGLVHVPNDDYTCFAKYKKELPGVRSFSERQLSLPVGWWLTSDDIMHIASRVDYHCKELASKVGK